MVDSYDRFVLPASDAEGVEQRSPGSRRIDAHPGSTVRYEIFTLKGFHNLAFDAVEPIQGSLASGIRFPGCAAKRHDPGLGC